MTTAGVTATTIASGVGADVRALLAMHAVYGVLSASALSLEPPAKGWAIFGCASPTTSSWR